MSPSVTRRRIFSSLSGQRSFGEKILFIPRITPIKPYLRPIKPYLHPENLQSRPNCRIDEKTYFSAKPLIIPPYDRKYFLFGHKTATIAPVTAHPACRNEKFSINPAFVIQKNIAAIDNNLSRSRSPDPSATCPPFNVSTVPTTATPFSGTKPTSQRLLPAPCSTGISNKTRLYWKKKCFVYNNNFQQKLPIPRRPSAPLCLRAPRALSDRRAAVVKKLEACLARLACTHSSSQLIVARMRNLVYTSAESATFPPLALQRERLNP